MVRVNEPEYIGDQGGGYVGGGSSGGGTWGTITGTLSSQADLQAALDAKQDDVVRTTANATTGTITPGASDNIPITIPKSCDILKIATNYPAWVVLYNTAASRSADAARAASIDPATGSGIMAEVITTSTKLTIPMSPVPVFVNDDTTPADVAYLKVQNYDGVSRAITVTITFARREA